MKQPEELKDENLNIFKPKRNRRGLKKNKRSNINMLGKNFLLLE